MSDLIRREDAIKAIDLRVRIPHDIASAQYASMAINAICSVPSADSEVVGKLKAAIESEEICKSCPTAERLSRENLLGAMALGFSYGMDADRPQEWIPCSEKLPEADGLYLATFTLIGIPKFSNVESFKNGKWEYHNGYIIAWMPLPQPWKGADDE